MAPSIACKCMLADSSIWIGNSRLVIVMLHHLLMKSLKLREPDLGHPARFIGDTELKQRHPGNHVLCVGFECLGTWILRESCPRG